MEVVGGVSSLYALTLGEASNTTVLGGGVEVVSLRRRDRHNCQWEESVSAGGTIVGRAASIADAEIAMEAECLGAADKISSALPGKTLQPSAAKGRSRCHHSMKCGCGNHPNPIGLSLIISRSYAPRTY